MLHGDEVAVAQVAGGAVVARAGRVVGIHLDEALAPLAQQADRQQPHLGLQLLLDVGDERGAAVIVHRGRAPVSVRPLVPDDRGPLAPERADLRPKLGDLLAVAGGGLARREQVAEAEEQDGREARRSASESDHGTWVLQVRQLHEQRCATGIPAAFIAWTNSN